MSRSLTSLQTGVIVMMVISPTSFLVVPTAAVGLAAQDAWMSIALATVCGCGAALLLGRFASLNREGIPFPDWLSSRIGKVPAACACLLLSLHYFTTSSNILHEFVDFLSDEVMPHTPAPVLVAVTLLVALYTVGQGIDTIARSCLLVALLSIWLYALSLVLLYNRMHPGFLLPIGEAGARGVLGGSVTPFGWFSEGAIILLLAPYMIRPGNAPKAVFWGVTIAGVEMLFTVLQSLVVFGPSVVSHMLYPSFRLVAVVEFQRFLERVDMFFVMFWIPSLFLKLSLMLFAAFHCLERTFRLRSGRRPVLTAFALLLGLDVSLTWKHGFSERTFDDLSTVALVFGNLVVPLALWACCGLFGGREKRAEEAKS